MRIRTKFYNSVNPLAPLQEYPRPQLVRQAWLNLNGIYSYAVTQKDSPRPLAFDGEICVPFAIESALSGVEKRVGEEKELWYKKCFCVPDDWTGKRIILHFGAVDWLCHIYINEIEVGSHWGGYNSFCFDITDFLIEGENELTVRVWDPTDKGHQQRGKQACETHGFWYTSTTGIWQTVWLEPVNADYIENIKLTPDIDKGVIAIKTITKATDFTIKARVSLRGNTVAEKLLTADDLIEIENAELWSPESPTLYDIDIELIKDNACCDKISSYFGMRKYSIEKDEKGLPRLFLNGKPYFQRGLLDQGYWSDGGMTPPSDEAMIYDIQTMKELGFNMLRKHIKTEPARWYYHCDRLGMLVWQDMISGGDYVKTFYAGVLPNLGITRLSDKNYKRFNRDKAEWREEFKIELFEMIDELYNCVSLCCWVPFNESWGQFDAKEIGCEIKKYDPSRFVDHASGWYDQGGPDFISMHKYILPVRLPRLDGERPFVLSEYGGYSMIAEKHCWDEKKSFGYMMYKSQKTLTDAFVKLHEKQIIPLISKGLSATVYTQVTDVEWEVNGMLTYDRKLIKLDAEAVKAVNERMKY